MITKKQQWIIDYINNNKLVGVDVLNAQFVDDYAKEFKSKVEIQMWGSNRCKDLGKQLSQMWKDSIMSRSPVGINNWQLGEPKWVYCYMLTEYFAILGVSAQ